jgi:4-hydroxy-3-methylbut-2-en-1-yl diphosphate reductase
VRQPTNDPASQTKMEQDGVGYSLTGLVAQMREQGNEWRQGEGTEGAVLVKLAAAYGYCWGVERAVRMAYEARAQFPDRKVYITNEIIHNPEVNDRLRELDIEILEEAEAANAAANAANAAPSSSSSSSAAATAGTSALINNKDYSSIASGDVVIFPAFGATVQEMQTFRDRGVHMVDTTCPWVAKVWNSVDAHGRKQFTSIIHGKYSHEETVATASFAETYCIVKNLDEAKYVCDYILNGGDREEFLKKFENALSAGFDPDRDLQKVGLANQTTMLKGETEAIGKLLERTILRKYGADKLGEHFLLMDTICDATQERQDALYAITDDPEIDLLVVVGGFNSSNTSHLQEIAEHKGLPSFWVDSAARIDVQGNKVAHKTGWGELRETSDWIPRSGKGKAGGPLVVGVTSGASTPDRAVEEVLDRIFRIRDPSFAGIAARECKPPVLPTH